MAAADARPLHAELRYKSPFAVAGSGRRARPGPYTDRNSTHICRLCCCYVLAFLWVCVPLLCFLVFSRRDVAAAGDGHGTAVSAAVSDAG